MLLSGVVPPPSWADGLIKTIESLTGSSAGKKWVRDASQFTPDEYAFGGLGSPGSVSPTASKRKKEKGLTTPTFPPTHWGTPTNSGSYFDAFADDPPPTQSSRQTLKPSEEPQKDLLDFNTPPLSDIDPNAPLMDFGERQRQLSFPSLIGRPPTSPFELPRMESKGPFGSSIPLSKPTSPFDTSALTNSTAIARPKPQRTNSDASGGGMKARAAKLSSQLEGDIDIVRRITSLRSKSRTSLNGTPSPTTASARKSYFETVRDEDDHGYHPIDHHSIEQVTVDLDKAGKSFMAPSPTSPTFQKKPTMLRKQSNSSTTDSEEDWNLRTLDSQRLSADYVVKGGATNLGRAPSQRFNAALRALLPADCVGKAIARFDFTAAEASLSCRIISYNTMANALLAWRSVFAQRRSRSDP